MQVAITGASGLIGTALIERLSARGHTALRMVRRDARRPDERSWDPAGGTIDRDGLRGVDALVHLAGESIGARWSEAKKRRILESRTRGTRLVAETLADLPDGPRVLVSASGINYYGDRGEEVVDEGAGPGTGFLSRVVQAWEAAADPARAAGVRVVHPRGGLVQSPDGGALARVLPLYKLGLGGRLGTGRQYWSWVSITDVVGIMEHALVTDDLAGPVNVVAPEPVTNADYTRILARVLGRPALLPVPELGPSLLLTREGARELLFSSIRARPARALASGYTFRHPELEGCLRDLLDRPAA